MSSSRSSTEVMLQEMRLFTRALSLNFINPEARAS